MSVLLILGMMILCLDFGDRYIGVAATDHEGRVPYRYGTIDQKVQEALDEVEHIIEEEAVEKVLVGVPVSLEGNETEQTYKSLKFIEDLRDSLGPEIEVESVDETLTTVEAQKILRFEGGKKNDEHAEAARIMLDDYLKGEL